MTRHDDVNSALDQFLAAYKDFWHDPDLPTAHKAAIASPTRVRRAIEANLARTGRVRFVKDPRPAPFGTITELETDTAPGGKRDQADAHLFGVIRRHTGYGAYLPIGTLMIASSICGRDLYKLWDRTVDVLWNLDHHDAARARHDLTTDLERTN